MVNHGDEYSDYRGPQVKWWVWLGLVLVSVAGVALWFGTDPLTSTVVALGLWASLTTAGALYFLYEMERAQASLAQLQDSFAAAYQLAAAILLDDEAEDEELPVEEELLLDVLADGEGHAAVELVAAPNGETYADIYARARTRGCGDTRCSCSSVAEQSPVQG